jgi:hypothetical protein
VKARFYASDSAQGFEGLYRPALAAALAETGEQTQAFLQPAMVRLCQTIDQLCVSAALKVGDRTVVCHGPPAIQGARFLICAATPHSGIVIEAKRWAPPVPMPARARVSSWAGVIEFVDEGAGDGVAFAVSTRLGAAGIVRCEDQLALIRESGMTPCVAVLARRDGGRMAGAMMPLALPPSLEEQVAFVQTGGGIASE